MTSNPFLESVQNVADEELVPKAQGGDRDARERLLARHHPWILNVAVRMLGQRQDAEDATQEILIRVLKSLHTFRGDSKFRTWLYRIAANHLLNFKRQEWVASKSVCSFADAAVGLGRVPDFDPPDPRTVPVPVELLVEETKIGCLMGTLLCLDGRRGWSSSGGTLRRQRRIGARSSASHQPAFVDILSRTRDLYSTARQLQPGRLCE
jgi:RNA polymerase sigma factor (sigma-70 family)